LELGCAGGGNLLPMAVDYPESQFIGIDASPQQVNDGARIVRELGLANLSLRALDILALPQDLGAFDYIICHGVFSWVPRAVQDRILDVCRRHLSPDGIAFVSYNAYPGWYLRAMVRDMMRYHSRAWKTSRERIGQARALLDLLVQSAIGRTEAFRQVLRDEAEILRQHPDAYLFHEHLEDVNQPFYFHEFIERAATFELQYVGDTEFATMLPLEFGPDVTELLRDAPLEVQEQYLDFFRNRSFRGTLLCHMDRELDRHVTTARLSSLDVALEAKCALPKQSPTAGEPLVLTLEQETITARAPVTQAALLQLASAWPAAVPFSELAAISIKGIEQHSLSDEQRERHTQVLAQDLLKLYARRLLRLRVDSPRCVGKVGRRPCVSPLVRWQAKHGEFVTNRRHESLQRTEIGRRLLPHLDGSNDHEALLRLLRQALQRGEVVVRRDGKPLENVSVEMAGHFVNQALESFAEDALLVS
jgi:methyltransferase-like protein/2-polyprenyl-3-methyl-5-hydroxy-6-metoxy-1,4-benzoquinol methylase